MSGGKYDRCEHCEKPRLEGELLTAVECWSVSHWDKRRRLSYWLVCDGCFESRHQWCEDIIPEICERCGSAMTSGEYYFENDNNRDGEKTEVYGLAPGEACKVVCEKCHHQLNTKPV
jgi:hypothetical protein